jgi:hypothetical protein
MNKSIEHILQFFKYDHLPKDLRQVSAPVCELANQVVKHLVIEEGISNPEITVGLRKLLEAKDCFVRARLCDKEIG